MKVITSRWQCATTANECSKHKEVWNYTNGEIIYPITTNFHPIGNKNFTSTQTLVEHAHESENIENKSFCMTLDESAIAASNTFCITSQENKLSWWIGEAQTEVQIKHLISSETI